VTAGGTTQAGVPCTGQEGQCTETFTVAETSTVAETTDPASFDCGGRCGR